MKSTDLQHLCTAIGVAAIAAKPGSITAAECRGGGSSLGVRRSARCPREVLINGWQKSAREYKIVYHK